MCIYKVKSGHHRRPKEMPVSYCCEASSQLEWEQNVIDFKYGQRSNPDVLLCKIK